MKVLMFAGTSEGRVLADYMSEKHITSTICLTTEHGKKMLNNASNVIVKRQNTEEIEELIKQHDLIIDATHPFAHEVTSNIIQANESLMKPYYRIKRSFFTIDNAYFFDSLQEACQYLTKTTGNILATTGSKQLSPFQIIDNYQERVYFRILPMISSIQACLDINVSLNKLIAIQGPFSKQLNIALLNEYKISYLVTKNTGINGGLAEKIAAAKQLNIKLIVIEAKSEDGIDIETMMQILHK